MNKILIAIVLVVLVAGGVFAGFKLAERSSSNSGNANTSTASTTTTPPASSSYGGSKVVDLSNKGLTKVTSGVYDQTSTTDLILSYNALVSLPSEMGRMTNLSVLKLDHNKLEGSLIGEIRKMPLKLLDASYNNMTGIPAEIGQLNQLQELNYSYNKIDTLPNEIFKLTQLKRLDFTGNPMPADKIQELRQKLPNTNVIF